MISNNYVKIKIEEEYNLNKSVVGITNRIMLMADDITEEINNIKVWRLKETWNTAITLRKTADSIQSKEEFLV